MKLTGKAKEDFKCFKKWYFYFLPKHIQLFVIYRWFNTKTSVWIDLQNWENDGFDYAVSHTNLDLVFSGNKSAGNRRKNFDTNLEFAIEKANEIYNNVK